MASGVAVVTLAVGAMPDIVVHSVTGVILAPGNPEDIVRAVRSLQSQQFQRESLGAAGRSRVVSRFSWERIALDAQRIYRQLSSPYTLSGQGSDLH